MSRDLEYGELADAGLEPAEVRRQRRLMRLGILIPLTMVLLVEGGLRLYMLVVHSVPGKSYGMHRADEVLGYRLAENAYGRSKQTNAQGFQNVEDVAQPKPKDSLRVIAYGGSATFSYGVPTAKTWVEEMQLSLRKSRGDGTQVLNAGDINWDLAHCLAKLKLDLPVYRPDYVLLYAGLNEGPRAADLWTRDGVHLEDLLAKGVYGHYSKRQNEWQAGWRSLISLKAWRKGRDLLYRATPQMKPRVPAKRKSRPPPTQEAIMRSYLATLDLFLKVLDDYPDVRLVFAIQARASRPNNTFTAEWMEFSQRGAKRAQAWGAKIVDLQAELAATPGLAANDVFTSQLGVHPGAEGSAKIGQIFAQAVLDDFAARTATTTSTATKAVP